MSFIADKVVMDGLTYDDVLLIPAYSEVLPKAVELTTKFSRNIELKIPFVTAAMDTRMRRWASSPWSRTGPARENLW